MYMHAHICTHTEYTKKQKNVYNVQMSSHTINSNKTFTDVNFGITQNQNNL